MKTPKGLRPHIGIFGRRNAGKSSIINALTNQNLSIVSRHPGTTTDPVEKAFELLPFGPVVFIDTAGIDDVGELGEKRVEKTLSVLARCDVAIFVSEEDTFSHFQRFKELVDGFDVPVILVRNKIDESPPEVKKEGVIYCSAKSKEGVDILRERLISLLEKNSDQWEMSITSGLIPPGGYAILVVPIDKEAPAGRLIMPQVQTIRDILDGDGFCLVVKERELKFAMELLKEPPSIVITDSQAFLKVAADVPEDIPMTSFSILFSNFKGDIVKFARGTFQIDNLRDGDKVLIVEACSHHPIGDDIGRVKIPRLLRQYTGKKLEFKFHKGKDFPEGKFSLIIHCGGCMYNRKTILNRIRMAEKRGIPITNYGMTIAYTLGIFERAIKPFGIEELIY